MDLPPSRRTPADLASDLARAAAPAFAFGLAFRLAWGLALAPLAAFAVDALVRRAGHAAVGNFELASFLLSPLGFLTGFVLAVLAATAHLLEMAGYQEVLARPVHGDLREGIAALRRALASTVGVLRLAARVVFGALWRVLPFVAGMAGVYLLLWREHDVNHYLHERPAAFWQGIALFALLGLCVAVVLARLAARWFLALPILRFEGASPGVALAESARRTRGRRLRVLFAVGLWLAVVGLVSALVLLGWTLLGRALLAAVGAQDRRVVVAVAGLLVGHAVLASALGSLASAGTSALVLRFHTALGGRVEGRAEPPARARSQALLVALLTAGALGLFAFAGVQLARRVGREARVEVMAHRGHSHAAPENTLAAIRKAAQARADWAEVDVQRTKDGVVVLLHDFDLMRVAGRPLRPATADWAELRDVDVGSRFDPAYAGARIPTLEQAIDEAVASGIRLNVEMKFPDADRRLVGDVVRIVRAKGFAARCMFCSLTIDAMLEAKRLAPEIPVAAILSATLGDATRLGVDALSVSTRLATPALLRAARRRGLDVYVWTVNDPVAMGRWLDRGVAAVLTDDPAALVGLRDERASWPAWRQVLHAYETWLD